MRGGLDGDRGATAPGPSQGAGRCRWASVGSGHVPPRRRPSARHQRERPAHGSGVRVRAGARARRRPRARGAGGPGRRPDGRPRHRPGERARAGRAAPAVPGPPGAGRAVRAARLLPRRPGPRARRDARGAALRRQGGRLPGDLLRRWVRRPRRLPRAHGRRLAGQRHQAGAHRERARPAPDRRVRVLAAGGRRPGRTRRAARRRQRRRARLRPRRHRARVPHPPGPPRRPPARPPLLAGAGPVGRPPLARLRPVRGLRARGRGCSRPPARRGGPGPDPPQAHRRRGHHDRRARRAHRPGRRRARRDPRAAA